MQNQLPYNRDSVYSSAMLLTSLLTMAEHEYNKLTPAEKQARKIERERWDEEYRVDKCINQGKCPYCDSKLIRGKKDKHNNYLRIWTCPECESEFYK